MKQTSKEYMKETIPKNCVKCGFVKWDNTGIGLRVGVGFTIKEFIQKYCKCKIKLNDVKTRR